MPFKSKTQAKKFFAMQSRGELPKGTAVDWARKTKNMKDLPEKVSFAKIAYALGRREAQLEKTGGVIDYGLQKAVEWAPYWAPAAAGAYLAGPGYRTEGALMGLGAGALGKRLGQMVALRNMPGAGKHFERMPATSWAAHQPVAEQIMAGNTHHLQGLLGVMTPEAARQTLQTGALIGATGAGAAAGLAGGRMLGAQNPYGIQPVFAGLDRENPMGIRPK